MSDITLAAPAWTPEALRDPARLAEALIARRSVTPADDGALDVLQAAAEALGFTATRHPFAEVDNLFAKRGARGPHLAFAGHTDVVPAGDAGQWTSDPFTPTVRDGVLYGRGAADMKGAIAAFLAAVARVQPEHCSVGLIITGDEEGPAIHGTKPLLAALSEAGETFDHVLVGEPTSAGSVGDAVKIGRRGSCNMRLTVNGRQGHVAYPERAANPLPVLLDLMQRLSARDLDEGQPVAHFQPSNFEITSVDVGNTAHNVIPGAASAMANIRFNIAHQGADLEAWIRRECAKAPAPFTVDADIVVTGEAFLTPTGPFTDLLQDAVAAVTGARPALTTGGGTSDARFIKDYAPVAELGLVGASMHQADEHVAITDLEALTEIYAQILGRYPPASS